MTCTYFRIYTLLLSMVIFVAVAVVVCASPATINVAGKPLKLSYQAEYLSGKVWAPPAFLDAINISYNQPSSGKIDLTLPGGSKTSVKTLSHAGKVYVDVAQIAKLLDTQIKWVQADNTCILLPAVKNITCAEDVVTVSVSIPAKYTVTKWANKLIIDIQDGQLSKDVYKSPNLRVDSANIQQVRAGMYNSNTARVVLDLKQDVPYTVFSAKESAAIVASVGREESSSQHDSAGKTFEPISVESAEIWDVDGTSFDLAINVSSRVKVTPSVNTGTGTLSLTLAEAKLADKFITPGTKLPILKHIKFTDVAGSPSKVRVDIVLNKAMKVDTVIYDGSVVASVRPYFQSSGSIDQKIVVIDAGHGGRQPGAVSSGVKEKDLNLSISRKVAVALRKAGATVIMTREADVAMDLGSRPQVALDNSAHFFISIHCNSNAFPNSVSGTETYYHGWNTDSIYLARHIQAAVCEKTGMNNRGARADRKDTSSSGFKVLRLLDSTEIPAVLLETGYLNNSKDRAKLLDSAFQNKVADAIVAGLKSYVAGEYTK